MYTKGIRIHHIMDWHYGRAIGAFTETWRLHFLLGGKRRTLNALTDMTAGSFVAIMVLVLSLIEITPIKVSPLNWLGKRINADALLRLDKMEKKLDEHIAEGYRNSIFTAQDRLLKGERFTEEEWKKVYNSCECYEKYIKDNNLTNGLAHEAIEYIKEEHKQATKNKNFIKIGA